jgi:hypothetical protein
MPLADELSLLVARINACAKGNKRLSHHLSRYTNRQSGEESAWYGGQQLKMDLLTGVVLGHRDGEDPLPIGLVLLSAKSAPISAWKGSGSGARSPLLGPLPACWDCLASWSSWPTPCILIIYQHGKRAT